MHTQTLTEVVVDVKTELPIEIVSEILSFTDRKTLKACSEVSKTWFEATSNDIFWNIYKEKIKIPTKTNVQGQSLRDLYIETRKLNAEAMKQKRRKLVLNRTSKGCVVVLVLALAVLLALILLLAFSWVFWVPVILYVAGQIGL